VISYRNSLRSYPFVVVVSSNLALLGCTLPAEQLAMPAPLISTNSIERGAVSSKPPGASISAPADSATTERRVFKGSGEFATKTEARSTVTSAETKDGISLNLVGASITEVAKTVLGDVLGVNYIVSDKVKGNITLHTVKPVSKAGLVEIFEAVLRAEGAALVVEGEVYKIIPSIDAAASGSRIRSRKTAGQSGEGIGTEIIPLRYVSATEIERVLKSSAPQAGILRVDSSRNLIVLSGTRAELASMTELVSMFDVDWMRGMSFGIFPIETGDPDAIAQELDVIFANDRDSPTKGIVRFVPNRRLKSVLVITSRPEFMRKAETWLSRIDMASRATEKRVHVYHVQHRPSTELAQLLQKVYSASSGTATLRATGSLARASSSATNGIESGRSTEAAGSAGLTAAPVQTPAAPSFGAAPVDPARIPQDPARAGDSTPFADTGSSGATDAARGSSAGGGMPPDDRAAGISVVADEPNNSLVITATAPEYRRMLQILRSIDVSPNQLMIEATIAEITLNDQLKHGLRWFMRKGTSEASFSDAAFGAVAPTVGGFNYFLNMANLQVVLNALSTITDVNVVSSPTLMVLENKKATLQVGDEVPISTQQAVGVQVAGAPVINSVSFRSTGVILGITPRVSDDGNVLLEIEQEVSDAVATTSSTIDSPTIQQRRVKTTVSVRDGESIVLAGFMQDRSSRARDQVPLLGDIPFLGNAFKNKTDTIKRTELVIAITPHIVKNSQQLQGITADFRDKLNFSTRPQRAAGPDVREQIDRINR
jgi:general secretion pathway protein D